MSNLSNQQINSSFSGLLQVPGGITSSLQTVQDGNGNPTGLQISSSGIAGATTNNFVPTINGTQIVGSVQRPISDGFGDCVSVKDFGAVGDGVADDTLAIQTAINSINALGGGSVYIPKGTYRLAPGGVGMKSNVTVFGDGYASKLVGPDYIIGIMSGANPPSASAALTNCEIRDLYLYCSYTGSGYQDAWPVYFFINNINQTNPTVRGSNVRILNCFIENSSTSAIMFSSFSDVLIQGNKIINSGENAIEFQSFWDANFFNKNICVVDNVIDKWGRLATGAAVAFFGRNEGIVVSNNIINGQLSSGSLRGMSFDHVNFPTATIGSSGVISSNAISRCSIGFQDTVSRLIVTGNTITDCSTSCFITGTGGTYVGNRVSGSSFKTSFTNGVVVKNPTAINSFSQYSPAPSNYNLVNNGSFALFSSGNSAIPDYWSDAAGDGSGSAPWTSIGHSSDAPPVGSFACQIVSSGTAQSILRQFFDISQLKGHFVFVSTWVKSSTANSCRIGVRTSAGDFYSEYAATGSGIGFVPINLAVWVDPTDVQVSVRLETATSVTASWAGVSACVDSYSSYTLDHISNSLAVIAQSPSDSPKEGTVVLTNVAGAYTLKAYVNGGWRSTTLT